MKVYRASGGWKVMILGIRELTQMVSRVCRADKDVRVNRWCKVHGAIMLRKE
jgi:hypothetical protein